MYIKIHTTLYFSEALWLVKFFLLFGPAKQPALDLIARRLLRLISPFIFSFIYFISYFLIFFFSPFGLFTSFLFFISSQVFFFSFYIFVLRAKQFVALILSPSIFLFFNHVQMLMLKLCLRESLCTDRPNEDNSCIDCSSIELYKLQVFSLCICVK